jgi:protein-disulfide isomerase
VTRRLLAALIVAVAAATSSAGWTPACDALTGAERRLAERLLASEYVYDCCDETIARCLQARPTCALAVRLADNVCRRVAQGQDEARIRRALSRRARSMVGSGTLAEVDLSNASMLGRPNAAVTVVVYACARCPYCSRLVPALHRAVTAGPLQGEARLVFRTFPIRGHEDSTEAGLAFVAAAEMGRFWEFLLYAYGRFETFSVGAQADWAAAVGLDPVGFSARLTDPATREALVASKKEGLLNAVEETPTLFINGRRWVGDLEIEEVIDAIEEEAARVRGRTWADR